MRESGRDMESETRDKEREVKVTKSRPRFFPKQRLSSVSRSGILKFLSKNRNLASEL